MGRAGPGLVDEIHHLLERLKAFHEAADLIGKGRHLSGLLSDDSGVVGRLVGGRADLFRLGAQRVAFDCLSHRDDDISAVRDFPLKVGDGLNPDRLKRCRCHVIIISSRPCHATALMFHVEHSSWSPVTLLSWSLTEHSVMLSVGDQHDTSGLELAVPRGEGSPWVARWLHAHLVEVFLSCHLCHVQREGRSALFPVHAVPVKPEDLARPMQVGRVPVSVGHAHDLVGSVRANDAHGEVRVSVRLVPVGTNAKDVGGCDGVGVAVHGFIIPRSPRHTTAWKSSASAGLPEEKPSDYTSREADCSPVYIEKNIHSYSHSVSSRQAPRAEQ